MNLKDASENKELLEIGRRAVEDVLIDRRDSRIGILGRGNGLVVREYDGSDSHIMRMSVEEALSIGLEAMAKHLEEK